MEKLKKAAKRVTAVAVSAAIVASYGFGAGLSAYPNNFVKNNKFTGKVVVGATADAMDTTSANSIIEDLKAEFSGNVAKVKITATKTTTADGTVLNAVKSNKALNYGDKLGDVTETSGFDDGNTKILADQTFDNGVSNEDYEQKLYLGRDVNGNTYGQFNYALRDNVDGVDKITDGIYFPNGAIYAQYVFDLKTDIPVDTSTTDKKNDFVGKTLTIMGVDYTISDIKEDSTTGISKLELIGGANKISLPEGGSSSVTVDGKTYDVKVISVSDDKVLLSVNGETKSIDDLDTDTVGGVNVAVTDLMPSSRDSVPGNAEIVIGGQKISLEQGNVKINDEDVNDINEKYDVDVKFESSQPKEMDKFIITYKVDDDVLLQKGDTLIDPLFHAFTVKYDGTNDVAYKDLTIKTDDDDLRVEGTLDDGNTFSRPLLHAIKNSDDTAGTVYMVGDNDGDRVVYKDSNTNIGRAIGNVTIGGTIVVGDQFNITVNGDSTPSTFTAATTSASDVATGLANAINSDNDVNKIVTATASGSVVTILSDETGGNSITLSSNTNSSAGTIVASGSTLTGGIDFGIVYDANQNAWLLNASNTALKGDGFLIRDSNNEDQYLYEVRSISTKTGNHTDEVSFDELLQNKDQDDVVFDNSDFAGAFEVAFKDTDVKEGDTDIINISKSASIFSDIIAFKNQVLLTLGDKTEVKDIGEDNSGTKGLLQVNFDNNDLDFVDETSVHPINVTYDWDTSDTEFNLYLNNADFVNSDNADDVKSNSDDQTFVNAYGVKVKYDNNDRKQLTVEMPDKEVQGKVSLIFGNAKTDTKTLTVDKSMEDAKVKELKDEGYTVSVSEVPASNVEFDVASAVTDNQVSNIQDLIVVGGPAVNSVARSLLGITTYTVDQAGVAPGEGIIKYYADKNSVLVYGYSKDDTAAAVTKLNNGGLSGDVVNVK